MLSRLSHWILKKLGWTLKVELPDLDKYVAIAAPHTSNWDFPLGILAAKAIKLEVHWLGKHSLFRRPYGWFFRAIGGIPVRRDQGMNYMQQLTDLFDRSEHLVLALAPEGTRGKTDHWKTGFHYIARAAKVPILMAYLDYGNRVVGIGGQFYPGDDIHADFRKIAEYYKDRRGKYPDKESLIRVRDKNR
ncbi:MAG: lysophospholipid acyltransferase family protein [Gammaproteobacteria bacterium]|nr:lysophospholipid acyltransferase family protein [Gammaproteobacteria bacterium]NNK98319.1 glycerol acyltransferase [Xanthomonadales bacterium]